MDIPVMTDGFEGRDLKLRPAGFISGPVLLVDGAPAKKENGAHTLRRNDGTKVTAKLKSNVLDPVPQLLLDGHLVHLVRSIQWYEYTWMSLPIPILLILDGGPIGAAFSILALYVGTRVFRSRHGTLAKYAMSAAVSFLATVACFAYNVEFLQRIASGG